MFSPPLGDCEFSGNRRNCAGAGRFRFENLTDCDRSPLLVGTISNIEIATADGEWTGRYLRRGSLNDIFPTFSTNISGINLGKKRNYVASW